MTDKKRQKKLTAAEAILENVSATDATGEK